MLDIQAAIAELQRELRVRSKVYPRLVFAGKLSQEEADRRTRTMQAALALLEQMVEASRTPYPTSQE